ADAGRGSIPYGRPMRNQTFEILDDRLEPCAVWVTGEMYIGGSGLADGYWRDPERTAESFIVHPRTGRRLYRTGDLGRWLPDGEIEIVGREDFQVKIRGYRVELGEIEAALLRQDEVRAAAVVAVGGEREGRRLAAVVVPESRDGAAARQAYDEALGDVITDPAERLAFKARRLGLRTDLEGTAQELPTATPRDEPGTRPRASRRTYGDGPVPLDAIGRLLEPLRADDQGPFPTYRYGSAGALYPVQTYLYVAPGRVGGLDGGTYYYDPRQHRLVSLDADAELDPAIHAPDNQGTFRSSAFSVFLVARREAVEPMYGKRARDFCLLEAGLMTQLLDGSAEACGIGLCQVGFIRATDALRRALALDDDSEVLHGLLGGSLAADAAPAPASVPAPGPLGAVLRERLAARLPGYMVPSSFTEVEQLPLTSRGKLDRRELQRLAEEAAVTGSGPGDGGSGDGGAESETEATILAILRAELQHDAITVHDHLLDIGADSVLIVRIHRILQTALDSRFPLVTMFEQPTVRRLADHLSGARPAEDGRPSPMDEASDGSLPRGRGRRAARRRR
ncbi:nitroreductase family protein, partial [Streptomyces sp. NPDC004647]|uniref:AMP-binding enzyme n=1 Tax=Streptomyces sp. NPDC004647 TaxID=3154671 RepID=UPI0033AF990A